jgi:hypothetical protein
MPIPHQADMPDRPDDTDMSFLKPHRADQSIPCATAESERRVEPGDVAEKSPALIRYQLANTKIIAASRAAASQ